MSDLRKVAKIHYQIERNREFAYRSLLSEYFKEFSRTAKQTLMDIHKATGISLPDISGYRSDRKVLTQGHAQKLADYFHRFGAKATADELIKLQKSCRNSKTVEARVNWDEFLANTVDEATHDARKTQ